MQKLIAQGAEAKIFLDKDKIIKQRVEKDYRIKEIDGKLRKQVLTSIWLESGILLRLA